MELAVDASVLVAELLRMRGRRLIADPRLTLHLTEHAWSEVRHELPRRLAAQERRGRLSQDEARDALTVSLTLVDQYITIIPASLHGHQERFARRRVPRDPGDWPTVALALTLETGIWTADADFLGRGVPTWTTETLLLHLDA